MVPFFNPKLSSRQESNENSHKKKDFLKRIQSQQAFIVDNMSNRDKASSRESD